MVSIFASKAAHMQSTSVRIVRTPAMTAPSPVAAAAAKDASAALTGPLLRKYEGTWALVLAKSELSKEPGVGGGLPLGAVAVELAVELAVAVAVRAEVAVEVAVTAGVAVAVAVGVGVEMAEGVAVAKERA